MDLYKKNEEGVDPNHEEETFNPKVYIQSLWKPPVAYPEIEQIMNLFEQELKAKISEKRSNTRQENNLTWRQHNLLTQLTNHPDFIVCASDKNLGLVVMERKDYIHHALHDHLLNDKIYRILEPGELDFMDTNVRAKVNKLVAKGIRDGFLTKNELTYFERAANTCHRITQFYITMKIHSSPISSRPVSGTGGTYVAAI